MGIDSEPKTVAYGKLKDLLSEAENVEFDWFDSGGHEKWRLHVSAAIEYMFGSESAYLTSLDDVPYSPQMISGRHSRRGRRLARETSFGNGMQRAREIVSGAIQEFEDYDLGSAEPQPGSSTQASKGSGDRRVFVVHGRDEEMKAVVARFLTDLDLEPVILHEQANKGRTIVEKVEQETNVAFAVVLLSPDDEGRQRGTEGELQHRARQNVVLELGFLIGKLGRDKVSTIMRGNIEPPSDIDGIVYISYDTGEWKMELVRELKDSGLSVDANRVI